MSELSGLSGRESRHLHQQHKLAKDLIRAARAGDEASIARLRAAFPDRAQFRLADAQLVIAREAGFDSWTKLVKHVEQQELRAAAAALMSGNAGALRRLLAGSEYLRSQVNAPHFDFGRRAIHCAAKNVEMIDVLLEFGADPNVASNWDKGPYFPLDDANEKSARHLIARGAVLTPNVAARLGWNDELRTILDEDSQAVHHRGGDGKTPLHEAKIVGIADLLLDRGADIDARCIDHKSTPAQYALASRPDVCRRLLERGATPDIFIAAKLGDLELAKKLLAADPSAAGARVNFQGYAPVPPFNIYCWELGWYKSPRQVANESGHVQVAELIDRLSDDRARLLDAVWAADASFARRIVNAWPDVVSQLTPQDHKLMAHAAHLRHDGAFLLMLELGFDPLATGLDGGTVLHQAAWTGAADLIEPLLKTGKCDLERRDSTHAGTALSWAAHGSVHCRHEKGDYPRAVEILIQAGARLDVLANKSGTTMTDQSAGNPAVQRVIEKFLKERCAT